jgi:hypothetical protein
VGREPEAAWTEPVERTTGGKGRGSEGGPLGAPSGDAPQGVSGRPALPAVYHRTRAAAARSNAYLSRDFFHRLGESMPNEVGLWGAALGPWAEGHRTSARTPEWTRLLGFPTPLPS